MSRMRNAVHLAGEIVIGRGRQMEENLNCKFLHTELPDLPSEGLALHTPPPPPAETGYTASILFPFIYSEFASNCIIFSLQVVAKGPLVCSVTTHHYRKQTVTPDSLKTLTIQTLEHCCHSCRRHKSTSFPKRGRAAKPEDDSRISF
jgi:hypothetical protein